MKTTVEISLYKLQEEDSNGNYKLIVKEFLKSIQNKNLEIETNGLSSLIYGDYSDIIELLNNEVRDFLDKYRSVFVLKISKGILKYKD
tara:strand:+ start:280 stop:543 length:264 start_codon:yes stop_codon:yes gene_type:complete